VETFSNVESGLRFSMMWRASTIRDDPSQLWPLLRSRGTQALFEQRQRQDHSTKLINNKIFWLWREQRHCYV